MKDHPLLLVPREERRRLLEERCHPTAREGAGETDFVLSDYLLDGELCHTCRQIHDALLAAYRGDWLKVLRHVQVERFYVSARYQQAAVTVEPQHFADAGYRQVTADRTTAALPPALHSIALFEPHGPLVAANRGLIEYSDLLKRDPNAFKYLLGTSETARVALDHFVLQLDLVLVASVNEKQLSAFKESPEFASFKGRLELVRVPYLRRASVEREIYDRQITSAAVGKHVAPHATRVAATVGGAHPAEAARPGAVPGRAARGRRGPRAAREAAAVRHRRGAGPALARAGEGPPRARGGPLPRVRRLPELRGAERRLRARDQDRALQRRAGSGRALLDARSRCSRSSPRSAATRACTTSCSRRSSTGTTTTPSSCASSRRSTSTRLTRRSATRWGSCRRASTASSSGAT